MGVILLDFICRSRIANGTMPENPVAVTTIVSTDMVTAVAKKYGVELRRVLTGFKYIGEQIALLEQGGHPERYIFGFEESDYIIFLPPEGEVPIEITHDYDPSSYEMEYEPTGYTEDELSGGDLSIEISP